MSSVKSEFRALADGFVVFEPAVCYRFRFVLGTGRAT